MSRPTQLRLGADAGQLTFDDMESSLREVTFVVVDLETTGGSAASDAITEIGAVKVRGGETVGEFATLVDPGRPIPPQIVVLTGITQQMVAAAPTLASVLPSFLEFAHGCALVAHNAPFDIGFLRAGAARLGLAWPSPPIIDTVRLARAVFTRAELPSVRLGVLAAALGARVTPDHRALHDAQATADVLHELIARLGPAGAQTLADLTTASRAVEPARQRKRHLAEGLPAAPGVYLFRALDGEVLYVGTSSNLRTRVRSYFTAAETRTRIKEMVLIAERIDHVTCASELEAEIREQRLIGAHRPRYNRKSVHRDRLYWVRPRVRAIAGRALAVSQDPPERGTASLGPFPSRAAADLAMTAARALGDESALLTDTASVLDRLYQRMSDESRSGLYEQAARTRDTLGELCGSIDRIEQVRALVGIAQLVAAQPDGAGGWYLTAIRHGRLAGCIRSVRGMDVRHAIELLLASAETVVVNPGTGLAAVPEETMLLLGHLLRPEVRIARASSGWSMPATAAGRWQRVIPLAAAARRAM